MRANIICIFRMPVRFDLKVESCWTIGRRKGRFQKQLCQWNFESYSAPENKDGTLKNEAKEEDEIPSSHSSFSGCIFGSNFEGMYIMRNHEPQPLLGEILSLRSQGKRIKTVAWSSKWCEGCTPVYELYMECILVMLLLLQTNTFFFVGGGPGGQVYLGNATVLGNDHIYCRRIYPPILYTHIYIKFAPDGESLFTNQICNPKTLTFS